MSTKPHNKVEWSRYRLKLTCDLGKGDACNSSIPRDQAKAFHALFHAVEELGTLMMEIRKEHNEKTV